MRDGECRDVASATALGSSAYPMALPPLDHTEHVFDLPMLPVAGFIESSLPQTLIMTAGRFCGGATMTCGNDRSDADLVPSEFMVRF